MTGSCLLSSSSRRPAPSPQAIRQYWNQYIKNTDVLARVRHVNSLGPRFQRRRRKDAHSRQHNDLASFCSHAVCVQIYVVDSADKNRLEEAAQELTSLLNKPALSKCPGTFSFRL